jgi:outer membrane receptor protein involved in Fe transport
MTDAASRKKAQETLYKLTPAAAAVVSALQPAGTALAQENNDDMVIDEIMVTATKRAMNIQDLAQSITALTEEDISRQGISSMEDIIKSIPSMTLAADQPGRNKIVFRGLNTGSGEYRTDSSAAVYLDEIPMTSVSQQLSPRMVDIERIEALPGPQGTLFGSSSQAGTIRYITNKPDTGEFSGSIDTMFSTTKGGDGSYDISGHINVPVADNFAIRAVAYQANEGGWIDNVLGDSLSGYEDNADIVKDNQNEWTITGGRLAAKWEISDDWDVLGSIISEKSETDGTWWTDPALGDEHITAFHDEFREDEWTTYGLTIKGDLGFAELTSASAYIDRSVVYQWDNHMYDSYKSAGANYYDPYSYCYNGYYYLCGLYDLDYILGYYFNDQTQTRFSQEIRLTSTGDSRLHWMAGLFYEDVEDEWLYSSVNPGLANTAAFAYAQYWAYYYNYAGYDNVYPLPGTDNWWYQEYSRQVKQTAVFGEVTFDITDAWDVTVGGRWFENDRDRYERNTFPQDFPAFGAIDTDGVDEVSGKTDDTTFKFATTYRFNDDHMLYLGASEGFRLGGFNSVRASDAGYVPREYDPDKVNNYELGNKSTFWNGRLRLNATAYLMKWDDIQQQRWNDGPLWWQNGTINGGKAESKGIELYASVYLTDQLRFSANISAGSAEYTDAILEADGSVNTPEGTDMPYAPDYKYWFGIDYTIPDALWGGDIWMRYDQSGSADSRNGRAWIDGDTGDVVQADLLPSWNIGNAIIGWQSESWQVNLRINNVWDKKYLQSFSNGDNWIVDEWFPDETRFRDFGVYNRPREVSLQIRKDF